MTVTMMKIHLVRDVLVDPSIGYDVLLAIARVQCLGVDVICRPKVADGREIRAVIFSIRVFPDVDVHVVVPILEALDSLAETGWVLGQLHVDCEDGWVVNIILSAILEILYFESIYIKITVNMT